jgi:catechol 2,3-dioxygenase-like lactoylglutathione lyase family enzyme
MAGKWARGLNHLALVVDDIAKARWFFETVVEAQVVLWRDTQLLVTFGDDLLVAKLAKDAIDSGRQGCGVAGDQVMDHYGLYADSPGHVDAFAARVRSFGLPIVKEPYTRADGRSFYFRDPFGNLVEYLYYLPSVT